MSLNIPIGDSFPKVVNALIEIPADSHNKYEYDHKLGIIKLDRVLHSPVHYPVDYGFIPQTLSSDGDELDIMVITNSPVLPGIVLEVRPVGMLVMTDDQGQDEKILSVPLRNPAFEDIKNLSTVNTHLLMELTHFFTEYKRLEKKKVQVKEWQDRTAAYRLIRHCHKCFTPSL